MQSGTSWYEESNASSTYVRTLKRSTIYLAGKRLPWNAKGGLQLGVVHTVRSKAQHIGKHW